MKGLIVLLAAAACLSFLQFSASTNCREGCYPVEPDVESAFSNTSLQLLVLEGQCYASCLNRYQDDIRPQEFYQVTSQWYSLPYERLNQNCSLLGKVLECKKGCMLRAVNTNLSGTTDNQCRDHCHSVCESECQPFTNANTTCLYTTEETQCRRICRKPPCKYGCIEYWSILSQQNMLQSDTTLPSLITSDTNHTGIISVTLSPQANLINTLVTSFIIKLEKQEEVKYMWFPTLLNLMLDLRQYSCQEISLSYAAVNIYGRTNFSQVLNHCITGEYLYPRQLTHHNVTYMVSEDFRDGFLGHAIINISWAIPYGVEYATHYQLTFTAMNNPARETVTFRINRTSTWFLLQSSSPTDSFPVFGTLYSISFIVHPMSPADKPLKSFLDPSQKLDTAAPELTLICYQDPWNDMVNISLNWHVRNDSRVIETITHQLLSVELHTSGGIIDNNITERRIPVQDNQFSYSQQLGPYPLYDRWADYYYLIKLTLFKDQEVYFWRSVPAPQSCIINASLPLKKPENITCVNFSLLENYTVEISWCPPTVTYGHLLHYQVSFGETLINVTANVTNITTEVITSCCYVQIRASNDYAWSEWSDPLLIRSCNAMTTTTTSNTFYTSMLAESSSTTHAKTNSIEITKTSSMYSTLTITTPSYTSTYSSTHYQPTTTILFSDNSIKASSFLYIILLGIISVLTLLIVIALVLMTVMCYKYMNRKKSISKATSSTDNNKATISASNKLAVDNIYSSLPKECNNYSTPV